MCAARDDRPLESIDEGRDAHIVSGTGGRFAFAHDLFREALYDALAPDESGSVWGRWAELAELSPGPSDSAGPPTQRRKVSIAFAFAATIGVARWSARATLCLESPKHRPTALSDNPRQQTAT